MAMGGQGKKVVSEIVVAFIVIILLVVLRPLFMGQVETASQPYEISFSNSTGSFTETITPDGSLDTAQANTIYSVVIFLVALIALVVILLTIAGKI